MLLRNYRKSGEMIWNEMYLQPMRNDEGLLTHYVGFFRDASGRLRSMERGTEGLPPWLREDRVTGLSSRAWFEELLEREWRIARREERPLTLVLFDVRCHGAVQRHIRQGRRRCLPETHRAHHRRGFPSRQ